MFASLLSPALTTLPIYLVSVATEVYNGCMTGREPRSRRSLTRYKLPDTLTTVVRSSEQRCICVGLAGTTRNDDEHPVGEACGPGSGTRLNATSTRKIEQKSNPDSLPDGRELDGGPKGFNPDFLSPA